MSKMTPEEMKEIRTGLGITQGDLARRVGVSSSFLSSVERDERVLSASLESRVVRAFEKRSQEVRTFLDEYETKHK